MDSSETTSQEKDLDEFLFLDYLDDNTVCEQEKEEEDHQDKDNDDHSDSKEEKDHQDDNDDDDDYDDDYDDDDSDSLSMLEEIVSGLTGENIDSSFKLALLTSLCDDLSLRPEGSLSRTTSESLAPPLVVLARQESSHSPDVMLFAIRAITYLCEAHPRSSRFLVENDVVSVLCAPLMAIEYLDVAEECIQALEKISLDHSLECLQAGVIGYILNFLDFFSSCVQRSGISTIENICLVDDFPSDCWTQVREAVPVLCNLLNYEDQKLVEHAASSLMRIVSNVRKSSEMVDEICKHGLIHQVVRFIASSSGTKTILSQSMYTDLIWLLSQLVCSGSITASNTLFELNVSCALKDILCSYEQSQNKQPYSQMIHEVIDLLNVLLPPVSNEGEDDKEISESKERIIAHQPGLLRQFGADVLPVLVQLVNSCADLDVCYGCLSVIDKIVVHFSRSVVLVDLLKGTPLASFLAGIISWNKDPHFLMLALRIVETVIQKLPAVFLDSFMKEGIVYAINALVTPMQTSNGKMAENDENTCLCYTYSRNNQTSPSDGETCMLEENSVPTLAKHITDKYFNTATQCSEFGLTKVLQKLRNLCAILSDMVNLSTKNNSCEEESLTLILGQIMEELNGEEPLSNFEFIQSGLVTSLVDYLSNGCYRTKKVDPCDLPSHLDVVQKRFEVFSRFCLSSTSHHQKDMPLAILMEKLQRAASSLETFPVISHAFEPEENYATIPSGRPTTHPCLEVCFTKVEGEAALCDYSSDAVHVEAFTSIEAIERYMWPEVSTSRSKHDEELATESKEQPESSAPEVSVSASTSGLECSLGEHLTPSIESDIQQLIFYLDGEQLDRSLTLYQAVLQLEMKKENDLVDGPSFWDRQYKIAYGKATEQKEIHIPTDHPRNNLCISSMLFGEPPSSFEKSSPIYEILILLKILEVVNKAASHVASHERSNASADGQNNSLDNMLVTGCRVPQTEFVSIKLTEKLEQQMQESLIVSAGSMPSWWMQLMEAFPFLFSFEARSKYFQRTSHGSFEVQAHSEDNSNGRQLHISGLARKKFKVCRSRILESAAEIMSSCKCHEAILEVEYSEEVGTGLGPTMEFFTLVSQEFQKVGLGMWREDHGLLTSGDSLEVENSGFVMAPWGLFPRPWSAASSTSNETQFSEVISKFILLGQVVAKALQDGRVLDLSLSKSFYKLILEQDLNMYDICSFDPALGRTLVEFQALVGREKVLDPVSGKMTSDPYFRNTSIEDLCLDFTLPGYCDYMLTSVVQDQDQKMVSITNLEEYVLSIVDATVKSGILRQVKAFIAGFNQVLSVRSLQIFTVDEIDQLLCGDQSAWTCNELIDNIKFNHGYTESSPPIINLLEIIQEFDCKQQRAFLQFVTGAPRLPPGGLAALNPKLTVVCKHCDGQVDGDLPSVMTCANYLKLPPYTSKDTMRERLMYAITEGQGSFHLS